MSTATRSNRRRRAAISKEARAAKVHALLHLELESYRLFEAFRAALDARIDGRDAEAEAAEKLAGETLDHVLELAVAPLPRHLVN